MSLLKRIMKSKEKILIFRTRTVMYGKNMVVHW
jgi:hypothetical protein